MNAWQTPCTVSLCTASRLGSSVFKKKRSWALTWRQQGDENFPRTTKKPLLRARSEKDRVEQVDEDEEKPSAFAAGQTSVREPPCFEPRTCGCREENEGIRQKAKNRG
jgi:hypothetical protein